MKLYSDVLVRSPRVSASVFAWALMTHKMDAIVFSKELPKWVAQFLLLARWNGEGFVGDSLITDRQCLVIVDCTVGLRGKDTP